MRPDQNGLTGLFLSGAVIYSLQIAKERPKRPKIAQSFARIWREMHRWRWLSVVLIAISFALLPVLIGQFF